MVKPIVALEFKIRIFNEMLVEAVFFQTNRNIFLCIKITRINKAQKKRNERKQVTMSIKRCELMVWDGAQESNVFGGDPNTSYLVSVGERMKAIPQIGSGIWIPSGYIYCKMRVTE